MSSIRAAGREHQRFAPQSVLRDVLLPAGLAPALCYFPSSFQGSTAACRVVPAPRRASCLSSVRFPHDSQSSYNGRSLSFDNAPTQVASRDLARAARRTAAQLALIARLPQCYGTPRPSLSRLIYLGLVFFSVVSQISVVTSSSRAYSPRRSPPPPLSHGSYSPHSCVAILRNMNIIVSCGCVCCCACAAWSARKLGASARWKRERRETQATSSW